MRSPRSLRGRLVLGAVAVGLVFAAVFGAVATLRLHQVEDRAVDTALRTRLDLVRDQVRPDGTLRPDRGTPQTDLVQVLAPDGKVLTSGPALAGVPPLVTLDAVRSHGSSGARTDRSLQRPDIDLAALGVPLRLSGASPAGTGALVVAVDAEGFTAARADLLSLLLVGLLAVVLAIAVLSWVLAGRALRSVTTLTEEAEGIRSDDLADGLPVPDDDAELTRLVGALNRMLARLHESHARELAFAADAGHRLRTPVATLRAEAELALREPDPAQQRAALRRIVRDADQLTVIVDRMLARNRSRSTTTEPVRSSLESAAARWTRQADLLGVAFTVVLPAELTAEITCPGLTDVVEPIVDNAVRHTPSGGRVELGVCLQQTGTRITVDVTNSGPGIPIELVPQVFDAWVSSRDASEAGGLGLWLARETARDTGGEVTLVDPSPGRTTFRVVLPCRATRIG
jgi:two-component system sensor histidine kinase TctE